MKKRLTPDLKESLFFIVGSSESIRFPPGLRYMAVAAFFFSAMSLLVKLSGQRLPSSEIVLARSAILLAICFGIIRHRGINPWGKQRKLLVLRGVLGFAALSCFYFAIIHLPLADATVIQFTNPAFTALIAALVLTELIGIREVALVMLSLAGVVMVAQPGFIFGNIGESLNPLAVGMGMGSAILSAGAWVTIRKLGQTEEPLVIIFYFALIATVGAIPPVVGNFVMPEGSEWLMLVGIGIFTHFGQINLTKGFSIERAGRVAAVGYLQIVFAAIWGAIFFKEIPNLLGITGALLIVGSTLLLGRAPPEPAV